MKTLALDLGTKTGWALLNGQNIVRGALLSGTINLTPGRYDGGGMRFVKFRQFLDKIFDTYDIEIVYFEEVRRHAGTSAAHIYGGFLAVLTAYLEERKVPYSGIPVGTIKKHATGKGNANKDQMIEAANKYPVLEPVTDDNEADAVCLLMSVINRRAA